MARMRPSDRTAGTTLRIPAFDLTRQHSRLVDELSAAARRVLESAQMILGPNVRALEQEIAARLDVPWAVGVASGTDGLYLALKALGIGPGDDVVTTPLTFIATVTSIIRAGARPVFADVCPDTLNLSASTIEKALTPATRAVVVVHLYGNPAAMDEIQALARRRGLAVVEDMAQAIGASYGGRPVGSWSDAAVISFYPTKNLGGCGDGGMVVTGSEPVCDRLRMLRDSGSRRRYFCEDADGTNSRLDELQAALLLVKLRHLDEFNRRRRQIAAQYRAGLGATPVRPLAETPGGQAVYHQFTVRTPERDRLAGSLREAGIGSTVYYPAPLHRQEAIRRRSLTPVDLEVSEAAAADVLSLPIFPELEEAEVDQVIAAIRTFFAREGDRA